MDEGDSRPSGATRLPPPPTPASSPPPATTPAPGAGPAPAEESVRTEVTRAIPSWDPARDTATMPVSRAAVQALGEQGGTDRAHPLPVVRRRAALDSPRTIGSASQPASAAQIPPIGIQLPAAPRRGLNGAAAGEVSWHPQEPIVMRPAASPAPELADGGRAPAAARADLDTAEPPSADATEVEQETRRGRKKGALGVVRELTIVAAVAIVLSLLVKTFLMQPFWIPSGSMNDTLIRGDRVVVSKLTPGPFDLKRGDVVVFKDPDRWLSESPRDPGPLLRALEFVGLYPAGDNHLIKRLIGLPGDRVRCDAAHRVEVNGVALTEPYVKEGDQPCESPFDIRVPPGRVWVMGDHRSDSSDSRFHDDGTGATGSVPISAITGRAVAMVWPLDRMGWLSDYPNTFDKVPTS